MISQAPSYHGYRFPPEIISHAVWLYHRFSLSFVDVEDLLFDRFPECKCRDDWNGQTSCERKYGKI